LLVLAHRWMTARELAAPRGVRDSCEGKTLKGKPTNGCGTKQGRGARACQETAEGLRKPESGTGAGNGQPVPHGASPGDVVEG
jgi:hypothetical protein